MNEVVESISRPWDKQPEEPEEWFHIFSNYYLPLGSERSLRTAFEFYIRVETPKNYKDLNPDSITYVPTHWGTVAAKYRWAERALEFDQSIQSDFSKMYVHIALEHLRKNALKAAESLVKALENDRTRVQAANSILNRSGIPETTEVHLKAGIIITSDDMVAAREKVDQWKTQR